MLGQRSPQTSLFEGDQLYLEYVGAGTFYGQLARERHDLFRDEDFAGMYHATHGRPSVPPSTMCIALLLQAHDRCSDAEARDRAAYDLRWKVALGSADTERPFTKSTLQLFRAQLLFHEHLRLPFERSLEFARKAGILKSHGKLRLAVDTTNILGRGAVRDTYNLVADGILAVTRLLAKASGKPVEKWAADNQLSAYLASSIKSEADIDWTSETEKQAFLGVLVEDARRVLEMAGKMRASLVAGSPADDRLVKATEVLSQVLLQDIEEAGGSGGRAKKIRQGTSADRIVSVHDPEMRHGRKSKAVRFDGHKMALTTDVESQLITAVDVFEGSAQDQTGSLELVQQSEATTGLAAEAVLGDMAYGSGENRERFAQAGIELFAKVPQRADTATFGKDRFEIDTDQMTCRCPAGHTTDHMIRSGTTARQDGTHVQDYSFAFPQALCAACPLRRECFGAGSKRRTVKLHPQEAMIQAAREWQRSPAFDDFRQQRQVVEHRIARMAQLGIRQARYFSRRNTLFQVLMAAAVANLTLAMRTGGHVSGPRPCRSLKRALLDLVSTVSASCQALRARLAGGVSSTDSLLVARLRPLTMATSRPGL